MTSDAGTRDRLLKTAEALFGERGFKKVTVREICRAAEANVAAVNYHFRDKFGLYQEVIHGAIAAMRATSEQARLAGLGQKPEERLRRYLRVFIARVLDPKNAALHRLIHREMNEPTPVLDDLVEQGLRPRIEYLSGVVSEIAGCDPKDPRVLRCVGSIQAQTLIYLKNPVAGKLGFGFEPEADVIERAADHIARFSVAGIRAVASKREPAAATKLQSRSGRKRTPPAAEDETGREVSGRRIGSATSRRRAYPAR